MGTWSAFVGCGPQSTTQADLQMDEQQLCHLFKGPFCFASAYKG